MTILLPIQSEIIDKGLDAVAQKYSLKVKRHAEHPNLVLLKYDQIDSPVGERAVHDCRALILDESDDWRAVSFPFRRFFNHGETHAYPVDWGTARVYDKEDGSLITLYHYAGKWHASTSGTPDGSSVIRRVYDRERGAGDQMTFARRFFEILGDRLPVSEEDQDLCFMFELCTADNRILVEHPVPRVVLTGVRDMGTLVEDDPFVHADRMGWECVKSYPMGTIAEVVASAEKLRPNVAEGYVVCDQHFNRVKVKSPQYVALHHVANGNSPRRLLEIVRAGESAEWIAYFPNVRAQHDEVRAKFDALVARVEDAFEGIRHIGEQKAFALEAVKMPFSGALFRMRQGKSARTFFSGMPIKSLCELVGVSGEDAEAEE